MATSGVENVDGAEQNKDPETMKQEESKKFINPIRKQALNSILESLLEIDVFTKQGFTEKESVAELRDFFAKNLDLTDPKEPNGLALDFFATIMELLTRWSDEHGEDKEPLSSLFQVHESEKKTCNRCKKDTEYPAEPSYGVNMVAGTLREIKYAFWGFTFANVLKASMITSKMPCATEGCGKEHFVFRGIQKLPSVFAIALEWEYDETEEEVRQTTYNLATEMNIKEIYKYEGGSESTKYRLVSMVCKFHESYNCVAYKNNKWDRHFGLPKVVTGDWNHFVIVAFPVEIIRPVILFYEQVVA